MVLPVVMYGTPVLRQKGSRIEAITPTIKKLIDDLLETMYAYKGIGLAAQQVGVPIQLTVRRQLGNWKVDAGPLIELRKAASN